jgi:hypothetical protein
MNCCLLSYWPSQMNSQVKDLLTLHPLRREDRHREAHLRTNRPRPRRPQGFRPQENLRLANRRPENHLQASLRPDTLQASPRAHPRLEFHHREAHPDNPRPRNRRRVASIRVKALSRQKCPTQCLSTAWFASEG